MNDISANHLPFAGWSVFWLN